MVTQPFVFQHKAHMRELVNNLLIDVAQVYRLYTIWKLALNAAMGRGVARVMSMCTHNATGTDLRSFSETGREWIFPNSWLPSYGATRSSADTTGGLGASPEENLKKRSQMVASDGICGKDIDL